MCLIIHHFSNYQLCATLSISSSLLEEGFLLTQACGTVWQRWGINLNQQQMAVGGYGILFALIVPILWPSLNTHPLPYDSATSLTKEMVSISLSLESGLHGLSLVYRMLVDLLQTEAWESLCAFLLSRLLLCDYHENVARLACQRMRHMGRPRPLQDSWESDDPWARKREPN